MKITNYRMAGYSWDISEKENVLKPLSKEEMAEANSLITEKRAGLFSIYYCTTSNGTIYEEILVGRSGWAHRGEDYYSIRFKGSEIRTKSYSTAIRLFIKKAMK
jgi:hypothetical protein